MNRYQHIVDKIKSGQQSQTKESKELSTEEILKYHQTQDSAPRELTTEEIIQYHQAWVEERRLSEIFNNQKEYHVYFTVRLSTNEYYNNGGSKGYVKKSVLSVVCAPEESAVKTTKGKLYSFKVSPPGSRGIFFARNSATEQDILVLKDTAIKDAIVRFGLNPKTRKYSTVGKVYAFILDDGTEYHLHGEKLPWHRFGDYRTDVFSGADENGHFEFCGMEEEQDGTYTAKTHFIPHNTHLNDPKPKDEWADDWKEMAEEGAQFSWMDSV